MKKIIIISIILILILITIFYFNISKNITGKTIQKTENQNYNPNPDNYTHTKAICNSTNYCQDYKITCQGNKTLAISPISGAVIQHQENWQDPRGKQTREKLCE